MTSSTSGIIPDGKRRKGGNRARSRAKKVKGGRVSKQRNKSPHRRVSLQEIQNSPNNVRRNIQLKDSTPEIITSSEDDAYEHVGTDQDCSEGSGSPTDQDTPTRLALAKRRETKGKQRKKITTRRLESAKSLARTKNNTPSFRFSSSVTRSSPCAEREQANARRYSPSPATESSLPLPSTGNPRFLSIEPLSSHGDTETSCTGVDTPRIRKNTVTGAERQLLDLARELILDFTLFRDPFPSALEFTGFIHSAWTDSEAWHDLKIEPSAESLNNVSTCPTESV